MTADRWLTGLLIFGLVFYAAWTALVVATNRPVDGRMSRADSAELRRAVEAGETRSGVQCVQCDQVATPTKCSND